MVTNLRLKAARGGIVYHFYIINIYLHRSFIPLAVYGCGGGASRIIALSSKQ
jgi:hypothetical protein